MNDDLTAGAFIRYWFERVPTGFIEMTYIHPETKAIQAHFIPVESLPQIPDVPRQALIWNQRGYGIYFGTTPSDVKPPYHHRRREYQVSIVPGLWCDLDTKAMGIPQVLAMWKLLRAQHLPSVVIATGGGLHAYWRFAEPFIVTPENKADVKRTLQAIATAYEGGDKSCRDMARVLRLPGTVNTKPGRDNALVSVMRFSPECLTTYEAMQREYAPFEPQKELRTVRQLPTVDNAEYPKWVKDYIQGGGALDGSRNRRLYTVARALNDLGVGQSEAEQLLLPAYLRDGKGDENGRETEGIKTISSAYRNARSAVLPPRMNLRMAWGDKTS